MYFINMHQQLMNNMRDYNSHTVVAAKKRITYKRYDAMLWKMLCTLSAKLVTLLPRYVIEIF